MNAHAPALPDHTTPKRLVLTVEQARDVLGVSLASLYRLMERGELRSFKVGRLRRVAMADLEDYVQRQRERAAEEGW